MQFAKAAITKIVNSEIKRAEKLLGCKNNGECGIQFSTFTDGRPKATFFFDGPFYDIFSGNGYLRIAHNKFEESFSAKLDNIGYSIENECPGRITIYKSF